MFLKTLLKKKQKSRNKVLGLRFWSRFWRPILVLEVESPSKTNVFRALRDDFGRAFGITLWSILIEITSQKYIDFDRHFGRFFDTLKIANGRPTSVKPIFRLSKTCPLSVRWSTVFSQFCRFLEPWKRVFWSHLGDAMRRW